jgi:hypothetical protein
MAAEITAVLPIGTRIPADGAKRLDLLFRDQPGRFFAYTLTRVNHKAQTINDLYSLYSGGAYATWSGER